MTATDFLLPATYLAACGAYVAWVAAAFRRRSRLGLALFVAWAATTGATGTVYAAVVYPAMLTPTSPMDLAINAVVFADGMALAGAMVLTLPMAATWERVRP